MNRSAILPEVLTLDETAAYLRLPPEVVEQKAAQGLIPGRLIADTWRFLKSALDAWLLSQDHRHQLLSQAGALADDESLAELRAHTYAARGRPELDEGQT